MTISTRTVGIYIFDRVEVLFEAILGQSNTRLPGARRLLLRNSALDQGIPLSSQQYQQLKDLANK